MHEASDFTLRQFLCNSGLFRIECDFSLDFVVERVQTALPIAKILLKWLHGWKRRSFSSTLLDL